MDHFRRLTISLASWQFAIHWLMDITGKIQLQCYRHATTGVVEFCLSVVQANKIEYYYKMWTFHSNNVVLLCCFQK